MRVLSVVLAGLVIAGCGIPSPLRAGVGARIGAASLEAGLDLTGAESLAWKFLATHPTGIPSVLVSIEGQGLDPSGRLMTPDGSWSFVFRHGSQLGPGVIVHADSTVQSFSVSTHGRTDRVVTSWADPAALLHGTMGDRDSQGPFNLQFEADPEGLSTIAIIRASSGAQVCLDAKSGQAYRPVRTDVAQHIEAALTRFFNAIWDQDLAVDGRLEIPIAEVVAQGWLSQGAALRLDRNANGQLDRAEFVAQAKSSGPIYQIHSLAANVFDYTPHDPAGLGRNQRTIDVPLGAKYEPGKPLQPQHVTITIPPDAFDAADADGDGFLSRSEAIIPIVEALVDAFKQSRELRQSGAGLFGEQALPWAH